MPVVLRKCLQHNPTPGTNKRKISTIVPLQPGNLKRPRTNTRQASIPADGLSSSPPLGAMVMGPTSSQGSNSPPLSIAGTFSQVSDPAPQAKAMIPSSSSKSTLAADEVFEFIGECYVHGMMAGEAFRHQDDTGHPDREFWLV